MKGFDDIMANVKKLEERIAKIEEEKRKTFEAFGEKVAEELNVTTPTEFGRFLKENSEKLNDFMQQWRKNKQQEQQRQQQAENNR